MTSSSRTINKLKVITDKYFSSSLYLFVYAATVFCGWYFKIQLAVSIILSLLMVNAAMLKKVDGILACPFAFATVTVDMNLSSFPLFIIIFVLSCVLSIGVYFVLTKPKFHLGPGLIGYLIFFLALVISSLVSHFLYKPIELPTIFYFVILLFAPIMYFLVSNSNECRVFQKVINSIVTFGLIAAFQTLTFYIKNPSLVGIRGSLELGWSNSNTAGVIMIIGLISSTYYLHLKGFYRFLVFLGLPIILGILLTISRQTIYSMVLFYLPTLLIGFLTFEKHKWIYFSATTVTILVTALACYFSKVPLIIEIVEKFLNLSTNSSGREPLIKFGFDLFKQNIFFGQGVQSLFGVLYYPDGTQIMLLHSTVVTSLASGGILTLGAVIAYYGFSIFDLFKSKTRIKYLVLIILIMTEFIGLVDNSIYNILYQMLVMMLLGGFNNKHDETLYPSYVLDNVNYPVFTSN